MTFNTQARIANDAALLNRVAACAASVGVGADGMDHPVAWANNNAWAVAAQPGWATAYAASDSESPGADDTAVTDAMILAAVTAIRETQAASPT